MADFSDGRLFSGFDTAVVVDFMDDFLDPEAEEGGVA